MGIIKIGCICLNVIGGISGIVAASYWLKASKVPVEPTWGNFEPVEMEGKALSLALGSEYAFNVSSALNQKAAKWTAASILFSAIASIAGSFI